MKDFHTKQAAAAKALVKVAAQREADGDFVRVKYCGPMCKDAIHLGIFEPTQDFGITEQL